MAEPDGSGGIRQYIRLLLNKASLNQLKRDVSQASTDAARQIGVGLNQVREFAKPAITAIQQIRQELLSLVKIPPIQALNPNLVKQIRKDNKGDPAAQATAIRQAQLAQQAANTTFTLAGRVLNRLGVDVYKSSFAYQTLLTNIKNVGAGVPPATASIRSFINSLGGSALSVLKTFAGQLGLVFSVYRLVTFAKASVQTAAESQAAWARLSSTLSDFGIPLSRVQGDIEKLVISQSKMGVKSQDTVEILSTLVQLTGDYEKSVRAVTVVTDLMIARHYTQEQAARAVGRAMIGDNMLLSRQGIILDKNRDAIEQLTERMRGELAARAGTLAGRIATVTSAFNDLKIAIGEALTQESGNWASALIDTLQAITTWVKENQEDFKVLAEVVKALGFVIFWVFKGIVTSIKLAEAAIGLTFNAFSIAGVSAQKAGAVIQIALLKAANAVQKGWDIVFHTHHTGIEQMIKDAERARDQATKTIDEIRKNTGLALTNLFAPEPGPSGPKAPDFALGTAGKIRAKVQQQTHQQIGQLRTIMLHGREDDAAAAAELLNKKLQEQQTIVSNLSQSEQDRVKNSGAILDAEENIAKIKAAQEAYEKKLANDSAQRREDAHRMQEIERLGRVAREADTETQARALQELDKIQASIVERQSHLTRYGERWFLLQNQIDAIENQRDQRLSKQDKEFKDQVDKLHDRLVLHVDEVEATKELEALMGNLNEQYREALKITNQQRREEELLRIARKQRAVEQGLTTDSQARQRRVSALETDLGDPAKRQQAEKQLLDISREINREIFKRKTLNMDITALEDEQAAIQRILAAHAHTSASELSKELQDARRLGKHWVDRQASAELYQKVIDEINSQLDGHIALTDEERDHLKVLLETAQQGLNHIRTITGSLVDEWKQLWAEAGDVFIANVADKIIDAWGRAAELMLWDLKDIKRAATTAFQGMGKAFASEIKAIALLRVKQHIAEAVSEGAEAIKALASHNYHAAALHAKGVGHQLAAAAKWALLAGAAGNIGGQGVSSAAGGGASANTGQNADQTQKQGPIIYLRLDGVDPNNPRHQQLVGATVENWQETSGGAIIHLQGQGGGR